MPRLVVLSVLALLGALALSPAAGAQTPQQPPQQDDLVIALLDTGIAPAHKEFAPGQVVAWWDFTNKSVEPQGRWFDERKAPYDGHGHGTHTAAMAAGLNADPSKTPSFAPGTKLAIAKVGTDNGSITGNLEAAFRWATDVAKADVINMSIGSIVIWPGHAASIFRGTYAAIEDARAKGVLVTLANGNGTGNAGLVPGFGASSSYSMSLAALAVGAAGTEGLNKSWDPEVVAQYRVVGPDNKTTDGYKSTAGTSFSAPLMAGFGLRLLVEARAAGQKATPGAIERLMKYSARDTEMAPVHEGYGVLDAAQLPAALEHARNGTLPARPSPDVSGTYVEEVAGRQRALNNGRTSAPPDAAQR